MTELCLSGAADFTSECVGPLVRLPLLVALDVAGTAVGNDAHSHLQLLTQLTCINIACTDCGVQAAEALVQLPRLREVSMCGAPEWCRGTGGGGGVHVHGAAAGGGGAHGGDLDSGDEMGGEGGCLGTRVRRAQGSGVHAVLALVPCMKLKRVVVPEKVLKDTRRSVEGCGGHVPAWMWGGSRAEADMWKHDLV